MSTKTSINQQIITQYLSADRLAPYFAMANDSFDKAVELYIENKRVSASLQGILAELEVILRNSINNLLIAELGNDWINSEDIKPQQREVINSVIASLNAQEKDVTNSNIISNLHFGFWVYFFNAVYDKSFWRKHLHKIFKNKKSGLKRSAVRLELEKFKKLRNRVAHCENILKYPHQHYAEEVIEFINQINSELAQWIREIKI